MRGLMLLAVTTACTCDPNQVDDPCDATDLIDPLSLEATLSTEIETIATLDLTLTSTADVQVHMSADGALDVDTPTWADLSGDVALPLYGMRPGTTYTALVTATAGGVCQTETIDIETGLLPAILPDTTLLTDGDPWGAWTLVSWLDTEDAANTGTLILDEEGVIVWAWVVPQGMSPNATWDIDDDTILVRADNNIDPEANAVYRVSMAGEVLAEYALPLSHHDIGQADGIELSFLRHDVRTVEVAGVMEEVTGDEVVELDLDGTERVVWNAFDCWPIEQHFAWEGDTSPFPGTRDWTHANGLTYCARDDAWLISTYYLNQIPALSRAGGCEQHWMLDGQSTPEAPSGDFVHTSSETMFNPQHSPNCTDDGVVLFDNVRGETNDDPVLSRGLSLVLDEVTATVQLDWSTPHTEPFPEGHTSLLGATQPLPDRSTTVGWGGIGDVAVIDGDGAIVWHVALDASIVGSTERRESLYGP